MTVDIKELLRGARLPEKSVDICLRGDLASEYEKLREQLDRERKKRTDSLSGNPRIQELEAEMEALREQMAAATITFRLRAVPRRDYQALVDKNPPRRDGDDVNERDEEFGFNRATFPAELLRLCVVEPELDAEDWALVDEKLNDAQFTVLSVAAFSLNRRDVDVPFSLADSPATPD